MTEQEFDMSVLRYQLEACLILSYMPFFLSVDMVDHGNGSTTFNITMGSTRFKHMSVNERVSDIFQTLRDDKIDLKDQQIVLEAFDPDEFSDLIDQSFI